MAIVVIGSGAAKNLIMIMRTSNRLRKLVPENANFAAK